eukprot:5504312-Alexandrium_andersonii.AAC.1
MKKSKQPFPNVQPRETPGEELQEETIDAEVGDFTKTQDYKDVGDVDVGSDASPETDFNFVASEDVFNSKRRDNKMTKTTSTKTNAYYTGVRFSG